MLRFIVSCLASLTLIGLTIVTGCSGSADATAETAPAPPTAPSRADLLVANARQQSYGYEKLGELCDTVGARLAGSAGMRRAVEWSVRTMSEAGFDSVWTEPVTVPHWTRGHEWARVTTPYEFELSMTGLGRSIGTGPDGIEAEILAVRSFAELDSLGSEAAGKIVVFYPDWEGYGRTVRYRGDGASRAAAHGAVACMVRSATGTSLATPHTGVMRYAEDLPQIPAAALSVEDAARLYRMYQHGLRPRVRLYMEALNHGETTCYNVVGQIDGRELPEEIVLVSGHLDSWDVGQCAQDNGAGCVLTMAAARLLVAPEWRPRRSIRVVHFTAEEYGGHGGDAYLAAHQDELESYVMALESDSGSFFPMGFSVRADSAVIDKVRELATPSSAVGDERWQVGPGWAGVDIGPMVERGVPGVGHRVDGEHYFDVHHSRADTFEKVDPEITARNVAAIAGLIYAVAEAPERLAPPRIGVPQQ